MHVEVIEADRRAMRQETLTRAFALRHEVFVEEYGFTCFRRADGLDIDAHDTGQAVHIVAVERDRVVGHVRIIPDGYWKVGQIDRSRVRAFAGDVKIEGLSRFCVASGLPTPLRERIIVGLFTTALDRLLARETGALLFETDRSLIFILRVLGFSVEFVGAPGRLDGRLLQPVVMRLDPGALAGLPAKIASWSRADVAVT